MKIEVHIVGLSYNDYGKRLSELFDENGALNPAYKEKPLMLRLKDNCSTDHAVAAYCNDQLLGYVSDGEKDLPWSIIQNNRPHCLEVSLFDASRQGRYLLARSKEMMEVKAPAGPSIADYLKWNEDHEDLPLLPLTDEENLLQMEADWLEMALTAGRNWDEEMDSHYVQFCQLLWLNLSEEMRQQKFDILSKIGNSPHAEVRSHYNECYCAISHLGSNEMRKTYVDWIDKQSKSADLQYLADSCSYLSQDALLQALETFPKHLYSIYLNKPEDAIARLYYLRLPAEVSRRWLTALLLQKYKVQLMRPNAEHQTRFTVSQVCMLCYYFFDKKDVDFTNSKKKDWIDFINKVTGYSKANIKDHLNFQANFSNPRVQQDLRFVADNIDTLFHDVAELIRNECSFEK